MQLKGNKKIINGWAMYDWANSVYSLVITTAVFPIYYEAVTADQVKWLGREWVNTSLYSFAIAVSFLIAALISPMLSGIADYSGKKKGFLKTFCYWGGFSCILLYFFTGPNLGVGMGAFILASIGYSGSIVFYNAYLPEIAAPQEQDHVSAKGYAFGYIGSVCLLVINLVMINFWEFFGFPDIFYPQRIAFLMVGIWWIGFAQITFNRLPKNVFGRKPEGNYLFNGYRSIVNVMKQLWHMPMMLVFLASFFAYTMGTQTVLYMATLFAAKEINLSTGLLILTILVLQLVAIPGAYFFSWLSGKIGNRNALLINILVWVGICVAAYFVYEAMAFIIVAGFVGLVMGGIQALSRSTYSKWLPNTMDHASFFSFYDVCEKIAIVIGTTTFGYIELATGSMRNALFPLIAFFVVGFILLWFTKLIRPTAPPTAH